MLSRRELLDILSEFLETCVNVICHNRSVYPIHVFARTRKYGVPVFTFRHPQLHTYVGDIVRSTIALADAGILEKVIVTVWASNSPPATMDTGLQPSDSSGDRHWETFVFQISEIADCDVDIAKLELYLRSVILKLQELPTHGGSASGPTKLGSVDEEGPLVIRVQSKRHIGFSAAWTPEEVAESEAPSAMVPLKSIALPGFGVMVAQAP
jgi:hypothetical protein